MRIVLSLGAKAIVQAGEQPDAELQLRRLNSLGDTLRSLADWHDLIITFADRPQVDLLASESSADSRLRRSFPLDALQAQAQGMLGYWIVNELDHEPGAKPCAAVITRVIVDRDDPAFVASVPSPRPVAIAELPAIADLLVGGNTVVCCGGGGIPVARDGDGFKYATIGTIDPDETAALLARELRADLLMLVTDVDAVYADFASDRAEPIRDATTRQLRSINIAPDTIGRKIAAACDFVEATGARAVIGNLRQAAELIAGSRGTQIHPYGRTAERREAAMDAAWDMVGGTP